LRQSSAGPPPLLLLDDDAPAVPIGPLLLDGSPPPEPVVAGP
jgi:hypothetical protein